jgi:hypothetical protein
MDPSTLLLIVAIISVAVGYAGGAIVTANRATQKKPKDDDNQSAEAQAAASQSQAMPAPEAPAEPPVILTPAPVLIPVDPDRVEITTLWRELPHGALRADFSGATVKSAKELTADQRAQLKTVMDDLMDWIGPVAVIAPVAIAAPAVPAAPIVQPAFEPVPQPEPPPMPLKPAPIQKQNEETVQPPVNSQPVAVPAEKKTAQSIVAQIDDILQAQIKGTEMESRGIRLVESPTHGVTVWIGLKAYQGMDTIPDEEVNLAIRTAVKEWEARK